MVHAHDPSDYVRRHSRRCSNVLNPYLRIDPRRIREYLRIRISVGPAWDCDREFIPLLDDSCAARKSYDA
ncbi:hypothetical protein MICRO8M_80271 [Microbacterium sp. 8M]|nr:hypothetical protein MICRO8M_80271 [Microbacterium sp. 8M]